VISQQDQVANMLNELMMRKRQELEAQRRAQASPNFDSLPSYGSSVDCQWLESSYKYSCSN
jgi:hypothetical protein